MSGLATYPEKSHFNFSATPAPSPKYRSCIFGIAKHIVPVRVSWSAHRPRQGSGGKAGMGIGWALGCCRVALPPCNTPRSRFPLPWVGVLWLSQDTALFAVDFEKALPAPTGKRPSRSLLSRVFSGHATRRVYPKGPAPRAQCPPEPMWAEMWVAQAYGRIESENIYMIPAITSNENISAVTTTIILFFIGDMPYWVR